MEEDDQKIMEFRNKLKMIKLNVREKYTSKTQDTNAINKVLKVYMKFFDLLSPIVNGTKSLDTLPFQELKESFYDTLEKHPRSSYYQNQIEYYLKRDLKDFPLTLDTEHINSFSLTEHYEEPNIIENIE